MGGNKLRQCRAEGTDRMLLLNKLWTDAYRKRPSRLGPEAKWFMRIIAPFL
jgi:hypothetical protein